MHSSSPLMFTHTDAEFCVGHRPTCTTTPVSARHTCHHISVSQLCGAYVCTCVDANACGCHMLAKPCVRSRVIFCVFTAISRHLTCMCCMCMYMCVCVCVQCDRLRPRQHSDHRHNSRLPPPRSSSAIRIHHQRHLLLCRTYQLCGTYWYTQRTTHNKHTHTKHTPSTPSTHQAHRRINTQYSAA